MLKPIEYVNFVSPDGDGGFIVPKELAYNLPAFLDAYGKFAVKQLRIEFTLPALADEPITVDAGE